MFVDNSDPLNKTKPEPEPTKKTKPRKNKLITKLQNNYKIIYRK